MLKKRSVVLAGHATSVALEAEFWALLEDRARHEGHSLAALLAQLDGERGRRPLASACRLAALKHAVSRAHENAPVEVDRGDS